MKKFLLIVGLFVMTGNAYGQGCDKHRMFNNQKAKVVEYKCVSPCDIMKGVGCYLKDTTIRVGDGLGTIITAPFKAKACWPKPETWRYTPPKFKWSPPRWEKMDYPDPVLPPLKKEYQFPLHREPEPNDFITFLSLKF
jgi:hypothetical protein|tara:strand:- start:2090 stop:2503 length:414 start_codon:yes stop_codon:yes gene_type:complete